jgi:hypothetical protein
LNLLSKTDGNSSATGLWEWNAQHLWAEHSFNPWHKVNESLLHLTGYRKLQLKPYLALSRYTWLSKKEYSQWVELEYICSTVLWYHFHFLGTSVRFPIHFLLFVKKENVLLTYLFQRKIENFALPSTGHGRHTGEMGVELCAFLINTLWNGGWLDPELAWMMFKAEDSVLVLWLTIVL